MDFDEFLKQRIEASSDESSAQESAGSDTEPEQPEQPDPRVHEPETVVAISEYGGSGGTGEHTGTENSDPVPKSEVVAKSDTVKVSSDAIIRSDETLYVSTRSYILALVMSWHDASQDELIKETKIHLVPLLYQLRKRTLPQDILTSLATIVYHLQRKEYKEASESYFKMSVGDVCWPVGVTEIGIKIKKVNKDEVANIMKNAETRKWMTAVKRLITQCENGVLQVA